MPTESGSFGSRNAEISAYLPRQVLRDLAVAWDGGTVTSGAILPPFMLSPLTHPAAALPLQVPDERAFVHDDDDS